MEQKILKYSVVVTRDLNNSYTYCYDQELDIGQIVSVDFRNSCATGVVVDNVGSDFDGKLKKIALVLPYQIPEPYIKFAKFVSEYNLIRIGTVCSMIVPFSTDAILVPEKTLRIPKITPEAPVILNDEQRSAVSEILKYQNTFKTILLHGITGSGKTEVFLEVAKDVMSADGSNQILILVPEIALSNELAKKVASRLDCEVYIWHNTVSKSKKLNIWKKAIDGQRMVIVGARSAMFIPFSKLGLIIIDEEHDTSFKQSETAIYNARDMAIYLGYTLNIPVILSSATPSIESYCNAINGKYEYIKLSSRYHKNATLPAISIDDLRQEKQTGTLSDYSRREIQTCLEQGNQALIFVNRRGHTPKVLCRSCGERVTCPGCSAWLCYHLNTKELVCHYCDFRTNAKNLCQHCGEASLVGIGAGIEKVQEECLELFPNARLLVLSSDTINTPNKIAKAIELIKNNEVDIILGTQIVAKGHNFNHLSLVVVTCIDAMLYGDDFRAIEKTFQLLYQVSGRAGRTGDSQGKVIIQTYNPDDYIMQILENNDTDRFYETEIQNRRMTKMPPFGKMVAITLSALSEQEVESFAKRLIANMPKSPNVKILGPIQPAIYKIRSRYRLKILVLSQSPLQQYISSIKLLQSPPKNIKLTVDIDPYEI